MSRPSSSRDVDPAIMQRPRRKKDEPPRRDEADTSDVDEPPGSMGSKEEASEAQEARPPVSKSLQRSRGGTQTEAEMSARFTRGSSLYGTRVSKEQAVRRNDWLDKRQSQLLPRTRGNLLHEANFPEDLHGLYSICYSPGGDLLACGYGNGSIHVRFSGNAGVKYIVRAGSTSATSVPIMWVRFNRKANDWFYAASSCGTIFACNSSTGDFTRLFKEQQNEVNALDVDAAGVKLVTGGRDTKVRVYDISAEKLVHIYQPSATAAAVDIKLRGVHSERVFAVRFHGLQDNIFLTGGWDKSVKIWDIRSRKNCVNTIFGPHICGDALDVKNDTVVTGSWTFDNSLQVWDMRTCTLIESVEPTNRAKTRQGEFMYVTKYFDGDPYGDMVLTAGNGTKYVEVISLQEKKVLGCWGTPYPVHAVDSYRHFISFGGATAVLSLCDFI